MKLTFVLSKIDLVAWVYSSQNGSLKGAPPTQELGLLLKGSEGSFNGSSGSLLKGS